MPQFDIDQITDSEKVVFSPNSVEAENWMEANYGLSAEKELVFYFPEQQSEALSFKEAVTEMKFTIGSI